MTTRNQTVDLPDTKRKLLEASVTLMRRQGFNATTVDDICASAGVTKGGFFHYFKSKEEIAKAALARFREVKEQEFGNASFRKLADPLDRVLGRLEFALESSGGSAQRTKGCLIGVFAQELAFTHSELRSACQDSFTRWAADFEKDLAEAKALHAPAEDFNPKTVAMLYLTIIQGSLILAKTSENNEVMAENLKQFRRYIRSLFGLQSPSATLGDSSRN